MTTVAQLVVLQSHCADPQFLNSKRPSDHRAFPNSDYPKAAPRAKFRNPKLSAVLAVALTVLLGSAAQAQQTKLYKIGWLSAASGPNRGRETIILRLRELGHFEGTKPADLPVEQPTKFDFVVNLKAAKQIGLIVPPNVLVRANRVIR